MEKFAVSGGRTRFSEGGENGPSILPSSSTSASTAGHAGIKFACFTLCVHDTFAFKIGARCQQVLEVSMTAPYAPHLHIVFSDTVGGSLKEALRRVGRRDRVIHLSDNLSFGPINPPDPAARQDWIRAQFLIDLGGREWPAGAIDKFWRAALSTSARRIVWVSKRAAHEYAGFLEFVWRLGDAPCEVVEFDQDEIAYRRPDGQTRSSVAICLGELAPQHFEDKRYWDRAVPLDAAARDRYCANWAQLRSESAPFRIVTEHGLVSAPITQFDDLLLSCAVGNWRKVARVVGEALGSFLDGPFYQAGDFVLHARLCALVKEGRLEGQGNLSRWHFSEVRLPSRKAAGGAIGLDQLGSSSVSQ
jgi:hypothetical protein